MARDPKHLYARVSLLILASGFSLLGALSLISRAQKSWAVGSDIESDCCCLGSGISIFAGLIFLATACVCWRRRGVASRFAALDAQAFAPEAKLAELRLPIKEEFARDDSVLDDIPANQPLTCGSSRDSGKSRKVSAEF